jgi:putative tryptophan/tyrosine transport system substrate-binding protein
LAAKAVTTTIPIVFNVAEDPVKLGLVASLARPGRNLTGINSFIGELASKRLELLHELLPGVTRVTALVNPSGPLAEHALRDIEPAGRAMGMQIKVLNASTTVAARSMRLSQPSCTNGPTPCSSARIAYSQLGVFN